MGNRRSGKLYVANYAKHDIIISFKQIYAIKLLKHAS